MDDFFHDQFIVEQRFVGVGSCGKVEGRSIAVKAFVALGHFCKDIDVVGFADGRACPAVGRNDRDTSADGLIKQRGAGDFGVDVRKRFFAASVREKWKAMMRQAFVKRDAPRISGIDVLR